MGQAGSAGQTCPFLCLGGRKARGVRRAGLTDSLRAWPAAARCGGGGGWGGGGRQKPASSPRASPGVALPRPFLRRLSPGKRRCGREGGGLSPAERAANMVGVTHPGLLAKRRFQASQEEIRIQPSMHGALGWLNVTHAGGDSFTRLGLRGGRAERSRLRQEMEGD